MCKAIGPGGIGVHGGLALGRWEWANKYNGLTHGKGESAGNAVGVKTFHLGPLARGWGGCTEQPGHCEQSFAGSHG